MPSLHAIVASTSGHTDYVVDEVVASLEPTVTVTRQRAEQAKPEDLAKGDVLLLACGSWNTGGSEGQLNPHMHMLLRERAKAVDLKGKKVAVIGLGDERYRYTARAKDLLEEFVSSHGGVVLSSLRVVNEPYGQEKEVRAWAKKLLAALTNASTSSA